MDHEPLESRDANRGDPWERRHAETHLDGLPADDDHPLYKLTEDEEAAENRSRLALKVRLDEESGAGGIG